jgi:hypothetical protein
LLAINLGDEKGQVIEYVRERNIRSTVLLDPDTRVGAVYQAGSIPMQVLIDREGVIRHVQVGYNPRMGEQLGAEIDRLKAN